MRDLLPRGGNAMSDKPARESISIEEAFDFTLKMFKETNAKLEASLANCERLSAEVEELMKVDYWQDRHNIVKLELEAMTEKFERLKVQYDERGMAMRDTGDMVRSLYEPRISRAKEILGVMRSASECDFAEMPYWSDQVIKILNGERSIEE
jgi:hypothetical protein